MSSIFETPELAIGIAVGGAAGAAFEPKIEVPKQTAWAANPVLLPDIGLIVQLVAAGQVTEDDGANMAARLGFDSGPYESLLYLAQTKPGFPQVLQMWRRFGAFSTDDDAALSGLVDRALAHSGLDWDYQPYLRRLKTAELIGLGDIAVAIVRGAVPAPPWVPVAPPTTTDNVPRFPVTDIDPVQLAAALGFDEDMLKIMTARSGLSLAPILATQALFRGALTDNDWLLAIAEGDLRTEWAETLKEAARAIPSPGEYAEGYLRGWITQQEQYDGAARHGMEPADVDLIFDIKGRPVSLHQITTGLARGGVYPSTYDDIPEPYRTAARESDIRPEWASIWYHNLYAYPSPFVLKALAEAGDLGDAAAVEQILLDIGWKPELAASVSLIWVPAGTAPVDPHVKKAQGTLWTEAHKQYVKAGIGVEQATPAFTALNIPADAQAEILALWDVEITLQSDVPPTA